VVSGPDEESYILLGAEQVLERLQSTEALLESARVKKTFSCPIRITGFGAIAAMKSARSSPRASTRGGHGAESAGFSFSRLRREVVMKPPGAAIENRGSNAHSHAVCVPPPGWPVTPTCRESTSGRVSR